MPPPRIFGLDPVVWSKLLALRTVPTEGGRRLLVDPSFPAEIIEAVMALPDLPEEFDSRSVIAAVS
jgi:hypothetical protein